jgi:undecaprenyl diphosphate synthase
MDSNQQFKAGQPRHVAIIMDGNNRWAKSRNLSGSAGHRAGAEAAREIVFSCVDRNIEFLTLFAFSSENWLRPNKEVKGLMALFLSVLRRSEIRQMHERNVRLQFIGNRGSFAPSLLRNMAEVENLTRHNNGTVVTVAADYGGHWDIAQAAQKLAKQAQAGNIKPEEITPELLQHAICLGDAPAPDLCIRTGGEHRISNFLLWQLAYSELYFTNCFWPDFNDAALQLALDDFNQRTRRYGCHSDSDELTMLYDDDLPDSIDSAGRYDSRVKNPSGYGD